VPRVLAVPILRGRSQNQTVHAPNALAVVPLRPAATPVRAEVGMGGLLARFCSYKPLSPKPSGPFNVRRMLTPAVQQLRRRLKTGVFPVVRCANSSATPESLARAVRTLVEPALAAVLVMPTLATPAQSAVVTGNGTDFTLTAPLTDWVGNLRQTTLADVPVPLRRTLMGFRALCVPVATPVLHLGVIVVPAAPQLDQLISAVTSHACDFALRLELTQRDHFLQALARDDSDDAPISSAPAFHPMVGEDFTPISRRSA
jgi:hypothetical protein